MMDIDCRQRRSFDDRLLTFKTGYRGFTPVRLALALLEFSTDESRQTGLDVVRLLLQESDNPPEIEWYNGQQEGFSMLQQRTDPLYYQRPLADRANVALNVIKYTLHPEPALMQLALGESITSPQAASLVDYSRRTILHTVAYTLAIETWHVIRGDVIGKDTIRDGKVIMRC